MNTTLKEIVYNLKNLKQAGRQSQDQLLQDSQYVFIVNQYRSTLIARQYEKGNELGSIVEQTLKVPMKRVRSMEQDLFNDKKVFKNTIPSVVQTNMGPLYRGVRKTMFSRSIERSSTITIRNDLNSPTTGDMMRWFPEGKSIFLVTPEPLDNLFVTAVFENPLAVEIYSYENDLESQFDPYDPYNFEYPLSLKYLDPLYKMIQDGELRFSMLTPNDTTADGIEQAMGTRASKPKSQSDED